jgi:hypothetical protein
MAFNPDAPRGRLDPDATRRRLRQAARDPNSGPNYIGDPGWCGDDQYKLPVEEADHDG